jgi:hypothetical protein
VHDTLGAAALYALTLPVLVAMAGIGFDYAHVAWIPGELSRAATAATGGFGRQLITFYQALVDGCFRDG